MWWSFSVRNVCRRSHSTWVWSGLIRLLLARIGSDETLSLVTRSTVVAGLRSIDSVRNDGPVWPALRWMMAEGGRTPIWTFFVWFIYAHNKHTVYGAYIHIRGARGVSVFASAYANVVYFVRWGLSTKCCKHRRIEMWFLCVVFLFSLSMTVWVAV